MARERRVRRVRRVQRKPQKRRSGGAATRATGKNRRRVIRVIPRCRQDVQDSDEEWCNNEGDDDSGTESERSSDDTFEDDEAVSRRLCGMESSGARVPRSWDLGFTAEEQGTENIHCALVSQGIMDSPAGRDEFMNAKEKGKEKVEGSDDGIVCGICFTEEIEVDRGKLDCCEHFFCFACILEWSKVESKCPICKQRFVTILKPARAGVTSSRSRSRTVRIPTRNQVYVPSQEEIRELTDPYATTACAECLQPGDDALLLLCDGCDVAAHTYCVGLGTSVPRGDWFCSTCSSAIGDAYGSDALSDESELEEDFIRSVVRTASRRWKRPRQRQSRTRPERRIQSSQGLRIQSAEQSAALDEVRDNVLSSGPSARTLSSQRVVQQRVQYIRQSWDSLRNGAASFPRMGSSSATTCTTDSVVLGPINSDVDRAWQMMERARSMMPHQQNLSTTKSLPGARGSGTTSLCSHNTKKLTCRPAPGSHPTAPNNSQITALGSTDSTKERPTSNRSLSSANTSIAGRGTETTDGKSTLVEEERRSKRLKSDSEQHEQVGKSTEKSTLVEEGRRSKRFKSRSDLEQHEQKQQSDASEGGCSKEHHTRTSEQHYKVHGHLNTVPAAKASHTEQSKRRAVKEQLSNIVKLELKTFYIDKKIGKEQYKDIARSATHVLLDMVHEKQISEFDNQTMKSRAKVVVEKLLKTRKLN